MLYSPLEFVSCFFHCTKLTLPVINPRYWNAWGISLVLGVLTSISLCNAGTLLVVQFFLFGWVEGKRWMDYRKPGSQAEPGSFLGLEGAFKSQSNGYPGGLFFDPLGFSRYCCCLYILTDQTQGQETPNQFDNKSMVFILGAHYICVSACSCAVDELSMDLHKRQCCGRTGASFTRLICVQ